MTPRRRLIVCAVGNVLVLLLPAVAIVVFGGGASAYFSFGPQQGLVLFTVVFDTWPRYAALLAVLSLVKAAETTIDVYGYPIVMFWVYNPDKTVVTEFTSAELQLCTNVIEAASALRYILFTVVVVTQFGVALVTCLAAQLANVLIVRSLVSRKRFVLVPEARVYSSL